MNWRSRVFAVGLGGLACSTGAPDEMLVDDVDSTDVAVPRAEMPQFPVASAGQVAVVTSHRETHYIVDAAWDAWAGRCSGSNIVQLIARTDSYGVAVLLPPTRTDSATITLPILVADDSVPPDTSARVALQIYPEDRAYVLKGVDGTVEIEVDSLAEFISGRFAGRLVESTYRDTVFAAGSFTSIPTDVVGDEYCVALNSPTPSIPGEGLEPKPVPGGQADDSG